MPPDIDRRTLLRGLVTAAVAAAGIAAETKATAATVREGAALDAATTATFEALADSIVPGEKRFAGDHAIAGAAAGPGAVQAGAIALLTMPELGIGTLLPTIAALLNGRAAAYALLHGVWLPPSRPAFVGLPFAHRTALVRQVIAPDVPDRLVWLSMAFVAGLAFDAAAHQDTATALRAGHPGLAWLGVPAPDADGLWRFPEHSYGVALAAPHPATTASGSPS